MSKNLQIETYDAIFSNPMPYKFRKREYLYVETSYDANINRFLLSHYDEVTRAFGENRVFSYIPTILQDVNSILKYNLPWLDAETIPKKNFHVQQFYDEMLSCSSNLTGVTSRGMILRYEWDGLEGAYTTVFPLHYSNDEQFGNLLEDIRNHPFRDSGIRYSTIIEYLCDPDDRDRADWGDINTIAEEIRQRVAKLRLMGVTDYVIRQLVSLPEPRLSRMLITGDYRIILVDYDNLEITMPTLSKVVYFFYLRHSEGVMFKKLADYHDELTQLYYQLSNRDNIDKLEQSIEELIDPTSNSINEKCSRIRSAFVAHFCDEIAQHYCITGQRISPKLIPLDRTLITDEAMILNLQS